MNTFYSKLILISTLILLASQIFGQAPVVDQQPISGEKCIGNSMTLSVTATGAAPLSYQWYHDENPIAGATGSEYFIASLQISDQGYYYCEISNGEGMVESWEAHILVADGVPEITVEPVNQEICAGETLMVPIGTIGDYISHDWYQQDIGYVNNGNPLIINNAQPSNEGLYYCVVENSCGSVTSNTIEVEIISHANISAQPTNQTVCEGSDAIFSITATGENLNYKWLENGTEIVGETTDQLIIHAVTFPNTNSYKAIVYNTCNSDTSLAVNLDINTYPEITGNPISQEACAGDELDFIVSANSNSTQTYQWFADDEPIDAETETSLSIIVESQIEIGYSCLISNTCGSVSTDTAWIFGRIPPMITQQPEDSIACLGSNVSIDCKATGDEPLFYQWLFEGADVTGDNVEGIETSTIQISGITLSQAGTYTCMVYNNCGSVITDEAEVTVNTPPEVILEPEDMEICEGFELEFDLQLNGTFPMEFEWVNQTTSEVAGTDEDLLLTSPSIDDTGEYFCNISNQCGSITTDIFTITINQGPIAIVSPEDINACQDDSIALIVEWEGTQPIDFLWYRNGSAVSWADNDTLILNPASWAETGTYFCRLHNECGDTDTNPFFLHIGTPPAVTWQPIDRTLCELDTLQLTMSADGENVMYQWYHDQTPISGANDTVLEIIQVDLNDAGTYYCAAFNACINVHTDTVDVVINSAPELELGPDQEYCEGTSVTLSPSGSFQSYSWNNGLSFGAFLEVELSGTYTLKVVGDNSCSNYDTIQILFHPVHEVDFGADTSVCGGMVLDAGIGAFSYHWSNQESGHSINISNSGVYWVQTTGDAYGCEGGDTITIQILQNPEINLGDDLNITIDSTLSIGVDPIYSSYLWSNDFTGPSLSIYGEEYGAGVHEIWLEVTSANGCTDSDTVILTVVDNSDITNFSTKAQITLYPVPASQTLFVDGFFSGTHQGKISLINIYGQVLLEQQFEQTGVFTFEMDVSTLSSGVYFVKLMLDDKNEITRKLLIQ